jgi:YD repeat-containing protein
MRFLKTLLAMLWLACSTQAGDYFYFGTNTFYGYEDSATPGVISGTLYRSVPQGSAQTIFIGVRTNGVSGIALADMVNDLIVEANGAWYRTSVVFAANSSSAQFSIVIKQNGTAQSDRGFSLDVSSAFNFSPAAEHGEIQVATGIIQDNDNAITVENTGSKLLEGRTNYFIFERGTNNRYGPVTVRFQMEGTALHTNDYDLSVDTAGGFSLVLGSTNRLTIPPEWVNGTLKIVAKNDALLEGDQTAIVRIRNHPEQYTVPATPTNVMHIVDDYATVEVAATDNYAQEGGNTGVFTITRSGNTNVAITINYTNAGTALPDSDYTALSGSVTLPAGVMETNLTVSPISGGGTEDAETVVLTLKTNTAYFLGLSTNAVVTIGSEFPHPRDTLPTTEYYRRGTGNALAWYSYVIPLDGIKGTRRPDIETNGPALLYHYNGSNAASQAYTSNRLAFNTPVVSFGRPWGTTLYAGETYGLTFYAGDPGPAYAAMNIIAYYRSNGAVVATNSLALPNPTVSNDWTSFATNGFTRAVSALGLRTTLHQSPNLFLGEYTLTHVASAEATNYFYRIESKGLVNGLAMAMNGSAQQVHSPLYEMQFDARPQHQAILLRSPHFQGEPLPPFLWNKTPEELQSFGALVTNTISLAPSACTNVDQSTELRRHPILDQFVADLNNDPIALANYVQNEIDLTDAIAYRDDGIIETESINTGGVNRGALGVYLEGQGSPVEQCALLIYLLRQAKYPATYVFPPEGGLKLLDTRVGQLLKTRINGAQDNQGRLYTTNRLITINYPWVAVYLTNESRWVHLFPWLKDTSLVEGFDLWDFLPNENKILYGWVRDYVFARTNLMSFVSGDDDSAGYIFPRYLNQFLETNAPGVSIDDIGVQVLNRRHLYSRWDDFPRPTWVTNQSTAVESLTSSGITNVSPRLTNIFNTVSVELFSVNNPQKKIATSEQCMADLHNRKFFLTHTNSGTSQHRAVLSLAPFRPDATNTIGTFAVSDTTLTNQQVLVLALDSTDDDLRLRFRHRRQRAITWEQGLDLQRGFLDLLSSREILDERPLRKGDVAAICTSAGRVTPAMLRLHAEELWAMERQLGTNSAATNTIRRSVYQGSLLYLMGMSYYERQGRFFEQAARLTKIQTLGQFAVGLAKLGPRRDGSGVIISGVVDPVWPNVDMFFQETAVIGNGTARPDSGWDDVIPFQNFSALTATDGSAQEHAILNIYFGKSSSVSTVKLLQRAQLTGTNGGIIELNYYNFIEQGNRNINGTLLKDFNPELWASVLRYFNDGLNGQYTVGWITPGPVSAPGGFFTDMAALILGPYGQLAAIGANQRGAFADKLPDNSVHPVQLLEWELREDQEVNFRMSLDNPSASSKQVVPQTTPTFDVPGDQAILNAGNFHLTSQQGLEGILDGLLLNDLPGTFTGTFDDRYDRQPQGRSDDRDGNGSFGTVLDPVNTLTGEYYVDETDLVLPGPMPLAVRRNYGSQNLNANQLGYGWKLNYMPFLTLASNNVIYASEPDGSVLAFVKQGTNNLWAPTKDRNPNLNNYSTDGIGSVANRFNARLAKVGSTYYLTNGDGSLRVFEERSFSLSASIDRLRPYLSVWYDNRGNFYQFEYGTNSVQADWGQVRRVTSSSGNVLLFYYDVYGRIVEAYSRDGRRVRYDYDRFGDLRGVIRPDASEIHFEYVQKNWVTNSTTNVYSTHLLSREIKPDGRTLMNEYDSLRRVTNQWATVGPDLRLIRNGAFRYTNNFSLTNLTNTLTGSTTVLDYTNNPTTYYYTNGLIRRIVDPLGASITQTWFEENETNAPAYPRSLKSVTDKRGLVSEFLYDARGNVTNTTLRGDLRGDGDVNATAISTAVFNDNNLPIQRVDAAGNTNLFYYTNTWLLSRTEFWPSNAAPTQAITNLYGYYSVTNPADGTVSFGLRQQAIRAAYSPDAATNEWTYDSRGFITQATRYSGTTDPNVTLTQFYNARGELIEQTDAIGRKIKYEHDAMGRPILRETFEAGQTVPVAWEYTYRNGNGEVFWSDGPRFDPEDYVWLDYDGNGRLSQQVKFRSRAKADGSGVEAETGDALYASSFNEYDPFNNLTRSIDPRGVIVTNTYDALGRRLTTKVIDTNGVVLTTRSFAYEPGNEIAFETNALGGITETRYTQTGKPHYRKNADGSTNGWRYYADARLHKEFLRNGSYWETTYQDAERKITKVFRASGGSVLATNISETDRRGNITRTVDAGGIVFSNVLDGLDRLKFWGGPSVTNVQPPGAPSPPGVVPPVKQTLTKFYSSAGQVVTNVNAFGEKSITYSDALGRPTRMEIRDVANVIVRETTYAYAPGHHSVTETNGSGASAVAVTSFRDNDENNVLTVAYPSSGVRHFTRCVHDAVGNLESETTASSTNGNIIVWTTSTFAHDGLGRVKTQSVRDGAITSYEYDLAGNVTNRVMPGGVKWRAAYDSAGRVLEEKTLSTDSATTRLTTFSYYPANHAFAGLLQTKTDGRGVVCTHTYDDFLRLGSTSYAGSSSNHNLTTVWQYDVRGPATNVTEYFASTSTGPTTTVYRALTPYQQVKREGIVIGGAYLYQEEQAWNSAGRRASFGFGYLTFGHDLAWRADGLLAAFFANTGSGYYTYDTAGRLVSRNVGAKTTAITQRDGASRILGTTTTINSQTRLTETLTWTGDGRLASHTLARSDFTDNRAYFYADQSRRLVEERFNVDLGQRHTNAYTFDNGQAAKAGVLTRVGPVAGNPAWSGGIDTYGRIAAETNATIQRLAQGRFNGAASVQTRLDGAATPLTIFDSTDPNWPYQWRSQLELTPGAHQLIAEVLHPSGLFVNYATNWFTNSVGPLAATDTYDAGGFLTQRLWKKQDGTTNNTQTLTWDAKGRLIKSVERDSGNSGRDWSAVYDGFGRLFRSTETLITNGLALGTPVVVEHFYDPEHEFLELGVKENGQMTWKVVGPDMDGGYGGQNGTGGFDAIVPGPELFCPLVTDAVGNVHAVYDQDHLATVWYESRLGGYGGIPGRRTVPLGSATWDLGAKYAWRNRASASVGLVYMGDNWLVPDSGQFARTDSLGFDGSDNGYTFCSGDPYNIWDADGRLGTTQTHINGGDIRQVSPYDAFYLGDLAWAGAMIDRGDLSGLPMTDWPIAGLQDRSFRMIFGDEASAFAEGGMMLAAGSVLGIPNSIYEVGESFRLAGESSVNGSTLERALDYTRAGLSIPAALIALYAPAESFVRPGSTGPRVVLGPEGPGQFTWRPELGRLESATIVRRGEFVNRMYDSGYAPGAGVSGPLGRSFAPGSGVSTTAAEGIQDRGLGVFYPNNAQQAIMYRATENIPASSRTSIGGTTPEIIIEPAHFPALQPVHQFPVVPADTRPWH